MRPRFMLDTDTVSYALRSHGRVVERMREHRPSDLCISSISLAELRYGAEKRQSTKIHRAISSFVHDLSVLAFDEAAAEQFASIGAVLTRGGQTIANFDLLIAGHALSLGLTLVTNNLKHLGRVPGLVTETWV